jgi:hypothetical protein
MRNNLALFIIWPIVFALVIWFAVCFMPVARGQQCPGGQCPIYARPVAYPPQHRTPPGRWVLYRRPTYLGSFLLGDLWVWIPDEVRQ